MTERVKTGIPGLDSIIEGGIPKNSVVTIAGSTGCGKTILASQFAWEGVLEGQNVKYISLEQQPEEIKEDALEFGWDFYKAEKKGKLKVLYLYPYAEKRFVDNIMNLLTDKRVDRLIIDPISSLLGYYENDRYKMRDFYYKLVNAVKEMKTTAIFATEIPESKSKNSLSRFDIEEFVVDGVIVLYYSGIESNAFRSLEVRKMRKTDHTPGSFPFKIERNKGIVLLNRKF